MDLLHFTNTGTSMGARKIDVTWSATGVESHQRRCSPVPFSPPSPLWTTYLTPRDFEGSLVRFLKTVLKTVDTSRAFPENRTAS